MLLRLLKCCLISHFLIFWWFPQVSHLQELVREREQNLGSAQTQITCLKETQEKLRIELDATRARVRETSNLLTDLQVRTIYSLQFEIVWFEICIFAKLHTIFSTWKWQIGFWNLICSLSSKSVSWSVGLSSSQAFIKFSCITGSLHLLGSLPSLLMWLPFVHHKLWWHIIPYT